MRAPLLLIGLLVLWASPGFPRHFKIRRNAVPTCPCGDAWVDADSVLRKDGIFTSLIAHFDNGTRAVCSYEPIVSTEGYTFGWRDGPSPWCSIGVPVEPRFDPLGLEVEPLSVSDEEGYVCRVLLVKLCPASFCGDGTVDPGERCEPPNTETCDRFCQ